jgi:hypothetical protein
MGNHNCLTHVTRATPAAWVYSGREQCTYDAFDVMNEHIALAHIAS